MTLLLILSFGGSLRRWRDAGILSREIELYVEYLRRGLFERVVIYSYGSADEEVLGDAGLPLDLVEKFEIIGPARPLRNLPARLAHSLDPRALRRAVKGAAMCKTNQISGSWTAMLVRVLGVPLFVRCGYILSRRHFLNGKYLAGAVSAMLEGLVFNAARLISVTTQDAAARVEKFQVLRPGRLFVAPTYVNTELFRAQAAAKPANDVLVYVGRLEPQKNLGSLIEACAITGSALQIIGSGSLRADLEAKARNLGVATEFVSSLQNTEIAALYGTRRYFVLPSLQEGLPKALIEAMSSEMICIGTAIPGTADLLREGETGYLAEGTDPQAIAVAIKRAQQDPRNLEVAAAARRHVLEHHSLPGYATREFEEITRALSPVGEAAR